MRSDECRAAPHDKGRGCTSAAALYIAAASLLLGCAPSPAPHAAASAPTSAAAERGPGEPPSCPANLPRGALVDLLALDPTIRTEIRYATADNFTGAPLPGYEVPRALLRRDAARSLAGVQAALRRDGLGIKVWDAYRPVRATLAMVEWAERTGNEWVLDQGYVARRSNHNRGNTVDLTLVRLDTGEELAMGTGFDDFAEAAHTANATGAVAANRALLLRAMEAAGWRNYAREWWHFTFPVDHDPLDVPLGCW
jgi:zinc D-Ala-D-Ala dipeptidase